MLSCAWLWVYAGAALMLLELVAPGFILCFFGLSAATVLNLVVMPAAVKLVIRSGREA